jgi:hypothetical protein
MILKINNKIYYPLVFLWLFKIIENGHILKITTKTRKRDHNMGNKERVWYPNTTHHITVRGNRRNDIFVKRKKS